MRPASSATQLNVSLLSSHLPLSSLARRRRLNGAGSTSDASPAIRLSPSLEELTFDVYGQGSRFQALIAPPLPRSPIRPPMSITSLSPGHAPCTRSPRDKRANKDPDTLRQQQQQQRELGRRHSRDVEPKARSGDDGGFEMIRRELDADCTIVISSSPLATPVKQERNAAKAEPAQARQAHKTRRQRLSNAVMRCHSCGTGDTPEWRYGPDGPGTLCNVCGLIFQKQQRRFLRDAGRRW